MGKTIMGVIRSFFGRIRKRILQLFLGKVIYANIESLNKFEYYCIDLKNFMHSLEQAYHPNKSLLSNLSQQINEVKEQNSMLAYEFKKVKTLLFLKEQCPELLHKFASGLNCDDRLINSLSQTNIIYDLQNDFVDHMDIFMQKFGGGAPGLSIEKIYETQLQITKNSLYKGQAFSNILHIFMPHYRDEKIADKIDQLFDSSFLDKEHRGTLRYILWLLLRKDEQKALEILSIYLKEYKLDTIAGLIPVADLAHRNSISNERIFVASKLFQTIIDNVNNCYLENYINKFGDNATIAIVGNGPHELGLGRGEEIDAHDIVVRFNIYNDSEKYTKDYGKKVNLCFLGTSMELNPDMFNRAIDIFVTHSLYEEGFSNNIRQQYKEKPFSNITTIGLSATRKEIQQKYGINWPTTGFRAVYFLKEILKKNIKKSSIYGFSLNHEKVILGHYDNTESSFKQSIYKKQHHDFFMEYQVMQDMFKEEA